MQAKVNLLNRIFDCRFRIDKEDMKLTRVILYGPQYDFEKETETEISAFKKMFSDKYGDPTWKDIGEEEMEIASMVSIIYHYRWDDIWEVKPEAEEEKEENKKEIEEKEGKSKDKKEIKVGLLSFSDRKLEEKFHSVISISYKKGPKIAEIEEKEIEEMEQDF